MRKEQLRMNEQKKYEIIKKLVEQGGSKNRVALQLSLSRRQIDRLLIIYKKRGKSGFIHGNRNKKPSIAHDKSLSDDIVLLYTIKYQGFNFNHFKEYLEEVENIKVSYNFIYNTLNKAGILSPRARKRTRKEYRKQQLLKEKLLTGKTEEEVEVIVNNEIAIEDSHPRQEKPKYFGEIIEQDGSIHQWFGDFKTCLHLAVDKATNTVVGGYFDYQETLKGYYQTKYQILKGYGIPYSFKTDNRTVFNYNKLNPDKKTSENDILTQYGYSCKQLGIDLKTSSVPEAKPIIERTNGTFQGRLINELKLNGIHTLEKANEYLINVFIPKYNKRFAMDYKKFPSAFEKSSSEEKINYTLAVLSTRIIDRGNSIKYKNKYYLPYFNNELKCFRPKTKALVIEAFNGDLVVSIDEKIYELRELSRNKRFSKELDLPQEEIKKEKYVPPMSHPWKRASFEKQMKKSHKEKVYA
ncbi:MAG: ISNCY family transposase [Bacilli bacterium]|jgi:hypothetical protein